MEDEKIIALYFDRSEDAIKQTDEKYGSLCIAVAESILDSHELAKECLNSVYFSIWNAIPPLIPDSLKNYILASIRNMAIDLKRKAKTFISYEDEAEHTSGEDKFGEIIAENELRECINRFLDGINETSGDIFVMRYYYGMSYKNIADVCGMSESAVKKRNERTKRKLKAYLTEKGYII